jgi:benzoate-CoA ligase family protein
MKPHRRAADLALRYNAISILEHNLEDRADKTAVLTPDRDSTFRNVSDEVNRVGNALLGVGLQPGESVAILLPDTTEWATTFFACLKTGTVAVGINTLLTPRELAQILRESRARVLVVHHTLLAGALPSPEDPSFVEHVVVVGGGAHTTAGGGQANTATSAGTATAPTIGGPTIHDWVTWIADEPSTLEATDTHREDFATLNFSSGTTGEPKGIYHTHADLALTAQLWGVDVLGLQADDRTFSVAKLFFAYGLGGNLVFPWYVGGSAVLYSGSPRVATDVLGVIDRFKPTILFNAPTGYASILAVEAFSERYDLSSLRLGVSAGEALPAPLWHRFKEQTGVELLDGIGSTENFHIFVSNRPGDVRPGSSGKPVVGYECRIVDTEGKAVSPGKVGNLHVKGETAALFYLHDSERSRQTFLGEWLNTGDKYTIDEDGYYWHAGRSDDMLKVGGIWVSPVEVESVLVEHESVLECAVVGAVDDAELVKPKALVVLKEGSRDAAGDKLAQELIDHCVERMAAYKRPRWVEFVDELPKTATGKIQRYRLR